MPSHAPNNACLLPVLCLQLGVGPGGVGMYLHNLTCGAWDVYDSVFTTQPAVAPRLPFPEGAPQITAATKAGPLVQSVRDCASLQVCVEPAGGSGCTSKAAPLSLSAAVATCWTCTCQLVLACCRAASPGVPCTFDAAACTQRVLSCAPAPLPLPLQSAMSYKTVESRLHVWMLLDNIDIVPESDPTCWKNRTILHPTQVYGRPHDAARSTHSDSAFSFSFGYLPDALVLQPNAEAQSFSIFNTTLTALPQGPNPHTTTTPGRLPPDVFTLLLWSINRCAWEHPSPSRAGALHADVCACQTDQPLVLAPACS